MPAETTRIRSAAERRQDIQEHAARLGIDKEFIFLLVETFYTRIRADDRIASIFENAIGDWPPHLATMKSFWASIALNSGTYSGKPVPKHQALTATHPAHFKIWLEVFEQTLVEIAPNERVVAYFMEKARRIAQSLKLAMFGVPGLTSRPI